MSEPPEKPSWHLGDSFPEQPAEQPNPPPSQEELKARATATFQKWIPTVWKHLVTCPVCGSTSWVTGEPGDLPARYAIGQALTYMPVKCTVCHYTIFFNMVAAGLFHEDGTPKSPEELELPEEAQPEETVGT